MPENLRITAPVPNSDGILKPNPSSESVPVEAANPARVNRPNTQEQDVNTGSMDLLLGRDSVFGKYIQQVRQTPALSETLGKVLQSALRQSEAAASSALPADSPLRSLAEGIAAGKGEMVGDLLFQQKDSTLFSGPLFQLLGRISERSGDPQLDLRLASFLKAFDGYVSIPDTTLALLSNLRTIERQIPPPYAKKLAELSGRLDIENYERSVDSDLPPDAGNPGRSIERNLKLLKEEILPLLSDYVSKSSDYGKMRETLSLVLHNVSILNISSREDVEAQFERLVSYCARSFPEPTLRLLRSFYRDAVGSGREQPQSRLFASLISLLSRGGGETDGVDRAVAGDICRSILLDNSVYMPFTHIYLPAVWQGRFLFAQIWVEKNGDEGGEKSAGRRETSSRLYLTFDIQDLGYFEARVDLTGKRADLRLSCPGALLGRKGEIVSSIGQILVKNGLKAGEIRVSRGDRPKVPGIVLDRIMERKKIVDVSV